MAQSSSRYQNDEISSVPGDSGLSLLSATFSFVNDIHSFLKSRINQYGRVFRTNLFFRPALISCSYSMSLKLLTTTSASSAYTEYLGGIYVHENMILQHEEDEHRLKARAFLEHVLDEKILLSSRQQSWTFRKAKGEVSVYQFFKNICEDILYTAVFGDEVSAHEIKELKTMASLQLNGLISAPYLGNARKAGRKADGNMYNVIQEILFRIDRKKQKGNNENISVIDIARKWIKEKKITAENAVSTVAILLSAVTTKALSSSVSLVILSILTNSKPPYGSNESLDAYIMETMRLYPPILGVVRALETNSQSRGWICINESNRDETEYKHPNSFHHTRWNKNSTCPFQWQNKNNEENEKTSRDEIAMPLTFGAGTRKCVGEQFSWNVIKMVTQRVFAEFHLQLIGGNENWKQNMKTFPVLRPNDGVRMKLVRKSESDDV